MSRNSALPSLNPHTTGEHDVEGELAISFLNQQDYMSYLRLRKPQDMDFNKFVDTIAPGQANAIKAVLCTTKSVQIPSTTTLLCEFSIVKWHNDAMKNAENPRGLGFLLGGDCLKCATQSPPSFTECLRF